MAASDSATALANALTAYSGALALLVVTPTGSYGSLETDATDARDAMLAALSSFNADASILAAVTIAWRGQTQSATELAAKMYSFASVVGCLNDTDAADAATAFSSAASLYLQGGH